jgi:hypothetical protein
VSVKKLLVVGLAVLFVLGAGFAVACGGNDEAAKTTMQDALTVVENDIAQLTATFSSGGGTGADIKTAIAAVEPHWQAVIDACAGVKGADAVKAQEVFDAVQTAVTALPDDAGLPQMAALLGPVQALQTFEQELRALVGGGTTTTVAQ